MLLDGIVDAIEYLKSAEAREANFSGAADAVFDEFLELCQSAGHERCALAGSGQTPAERVEPLFAQVKIAPIPAPGVTPPLLSPWTLNYSDLLLSQFEPMRAPSTWPSNAANLDAALRGDASALASRAALFLSPAGWAPAIASAAIQCADAPADQSPQAWPQVIGHLQQVGRLQGLMHGWWEWAPCASWPVRARTTSILNSKVAQNRRRQAKWLNEICLNCAVRASKWARRRCADGETTHPLLNERRTF